MNSNFGRVLHEKPDIALLRKNGYTCIDMHFHSKHSDGVNNIDYILKKAQKLGCGVCITDHNQAKGSIIAAKQKAVMTIPGIETTTKEGAHTLYYFYSPRGLDSFFAKEVKPFVKKTSPFLKVTAEELLDRSNGYDCISIMAHPYAVTWTGMMNCIRHRTIDKRVIEKIDGIEVICGANQRLPNKKAIELALKLKDKMVTGGSDGHIFYELGHTLTCAKECESPTDFLQSIEKRRNMVIGKETKFIRKYLAHSTKGTTRGKYALNYLGRCFKYGKDSIKIRIKK